MNKWNATGRLTKDPVIRYTQEEMAVARFTLAVSRRYAKESEKQADFFSCVAFGKQAEFIEKHMKKGMKADLTGRLQNDEYTNRDGYKIVTVVVVVEEIEFGESKKTQAGQMQEDGFMPAQDDIDSEELPFDL